MDESKPEVTLTALGLWKAIKGYPALLIPILVSVVWLETMAAQTVIMLPMSSGSTLYLLIVIVGVLLGLIGYFAGDFWDGRLFDPRYGLGGKWLDSHTRPFAVFPAGSDLEQCRDKAIRALFGRRHSGEGIYREAKKVAMKQPEKWDYIEQPLILSKIVRCFIWPCFLIFAGSILAAIGSLIFGWALNLAAMIIAGVGVFCFGILLFIPYFQLRIEHMIRLYECAYEGVHKGGPAPPET